MIILADSYSLRHNVNRSHTNMTGCRALYARVTSDGLETCYNHDIYGHMKTMAYHDTAGNLSVLTLTMTPRETEFEEAYDAETYRKAEAILPTPMMH